MYKKICHKEEYVAAGGVGWTLVMGNEAADMDSFVSSIVYAHYLRQHRGEKAMALINIPRQEAALRCEAEFMLEEDAGLSFARDMCFVSGDESFQGFDYTTRLVLVDHNALAHTQQQLAPKVCGIIDHHVDQGLYTPPVRIIERVGSACSLVTRILKEDDAFELPANLARLLLGVILLDTHNMDPGVKKGTPTDQQAINWLHHKAGIAETSLADWFTTLLDKRQDVSHLTPDQLLRRDSKYGQSGVYSFGIASVNVPLDSFFTQVGAHESLAAFAEERKLHVTLIMSAASVKGRFSRELCLYCTRQDLRESLCQALEAKRDLLDVTRLDLPVHCTNNSQQEPPSNTVVAWTQAQLASSRKQVLPLLVSLLSSL